MFSNPRSNGANAMPCTVPTLPAEEQSKPGPPGAATQAAGIPCVADSPVSPVVATALPGSRSSDPLHAPRVLLAEDNGDLQAILELHLVRLGFEAVVVSNGREAVDQTLAACRLGEPFDLILMDLEMPILDGYLAIRLVREGGHSGPILAITAHSCDDPLLNCLDIGCDDCLSKPFNWGSLRTLVRKLVPGISLAPDA